MTRRVALVEIDAQAPGAKTYTAWNPADKTANTTLSGSNLTATAATTTFYNAVRAVLGISAGQHYWETVHNFASGNVLSGICTAAFTMSATNMGTDAGGLSVAGPRADGVCFYKNANVGDAGTVTTGTLVRHWLDMDSGTYRVAIAAGGFLTVVTGLAGTWYPVAQFQTAGHSIVANFGASAFTYSTPAGARTGLYAVGAATSNVLRLASEAVFTDAAATPASSYYQPRVLPSDITMKRKASAWPMASSGAEFAVGEVVFANDDNALDSWRDLIFRDRVVTIRYGTPTQALRPDLCTLWLSAICDRVEFRDKTVVLKITDLRSRLNKPLQAATYASGAADAPMVDRPKPVTIGKALNVDPVFYDTANRRYDCHDDSDIMITEVTDQADPDVLITDYRQYNGGFSTTVAHVGKTAATVYGESTVYADQIGADGDMTTWVAGAFTTNPQGWTVTGETSATVGVHQSPAGSAQLRNTGGGGQVLLGKTAFGAGGVTGYLVDFTVTAFVSGSLRIWSSTAANVATTQRVAGIAATGTYRILIQPAATETFIVFGVVAASNSDISIDAVHVYPLNAVEYITEWLTHLCVTRGGLVAGDLDAAAIATLDAAARYTLGFFTRDAVNIDQVLRDTMDSFCGWIVPKADGKLTVGRLEEPSSSPTLSLTRYDLIGRPTCTLDTAKGLTNQLGAARNWTVHGDSDFATSVPAATREKLKLAYQEACKALGAVSSTYAHATSAALRGTLLQTRAHGLAEISRVATLYSQDRFFYEIPALMDISTANSLALGATIRLTYPAFDLTNGKNLVVLGVESSFRRQRALLTCWG